ncbi:MAG: hypothetical protein BGO41_05250 [Clostridiales bacterium 38-18]|nr:MAG: hypothetical protein BGO41_05250 [Clostridiales bacterium 38-18]
MLKFLIIYNPEKIKISSFLNDLNASVPSNTIKHFQFEKEDTNTSGSTLISNVRGADIIAEHRNNRSITHFVFHCSQNCHFKHLSQELHQLSKSHKIDINTFYFSNSIHFIKQNRQSNSIILENANLLLVEKNKPDLLSFNLIKLWLTFNYPNLNIEFLNDVRSWQTILNENNDSNKDRSLKPIGILVTILFLGLLLPSYETVFPYIMKVIQLFLGVFLQAFPFLMLGVILSSLIQVYVSSDWVESHFPKSIGKGALVAIITGFFLPVCDCASVPVFKSLIKKGVPLPAAITFLTVSPVINPVIIFSTYYAFGGNWRFVIERVLLGVIVALVTSLYFHFKPSTEITNEIIKQETTPTIILDSLSVVKKKNKQPIMAVIHHSKSEFLDVSRYLVFGIFISAIIQSVLPNFTFDGSTLLFEPIYIIGGILLAFLLSLCSSSDALVAQSFQYSVPRSALLAFLVFGPMMDIKNVAMLSAAFNKKFIIKLTITIAVAVFAVLLIAFAVSQII